MVLEQSRRENRFSRHKKKSAFAAVIGMLVLIELSCYVIVRSVGHAEKREMYPYNRIISGYTVYRHTPGFNFGVSTIKVSPDDSNVAFDRNGFICDSEVELQKPAGVVRIFIMGGSTAIGAGQTEGYDSIHKYPMGNYSYRASIAGQLNAWLTKKYPETEFQVITAASYGRKLHQSYIDYAASVSRFSPDIVITCDGMNDLASIESGTPFSDTEADIAHYIDLWNNHYRKPLIARTNTYYVLERISHRLGIQKLHSPSRVTESFPAAESEEEYHENREEFIRNAARSLQVASQFRAAVESDGSTFVFCLQPLLHRARTNKQLSSIEAKLDRLMLVSNAAPEKAARMRQINKYFFDDYLCSQLRQECGHGGFIDVNAKIIDLNRNREFYTDYCHLTEEGNRITAEILGRHLDAHFPSIFLGGR